MTSPSAANAPTFKLTWRGAEDQMALIADLMADALDPPAEAVSLRKVVEDGSNHETDFLAEADFAEPPDQDASATLIGHVVEAPGPWTFVGRISEHDPLIARTFFLVQALTSLNALG
ncbi:MAG: hypothetical protein AAF199_07100, partial [Pseudomonadota bacterium]